MAALSSNPAAAMAAAAGMGGGMPGSQDAAMMQLQYYRLMKSVVPSEQIDRLFPPEIRERFEMALKAQVSVTVTVTVTVGDTQYLGVETHFIAVLALLKYTGLAESENAKCRTAHIRLYMFR